MASLVGMPHRKMHFQRSLLSVVFINQQMVFASPIGRVPRLTSGEDPGDSQVLFRRMRIGQGILVFLSVWGTPASSMGGLEGVSGKSGRGAS